MNFIHFEASENSQQNEALAFSDDDENKENGNVLETFIADTEQNLSVYRKFDPEDLSQYNKFPNQTRDPMQVVYEGNKMRLKKGNQFNLINFQAMKSQFKLKKNTS